MTEHKTYPSKGIEKKGGYPSSSKPNSQLKPPPPSISKPKSKAS